MLEHAVYSAARPSWNVIAGVRPDMLQAAREQWIGIDSIAIEKTVGQADTIYQLLEGVSGPVLIINSDAALCVPWAIWGLTGISLETLCIEVSHLKKRIYDESPYSHVDDAPLFESMAEKIYLSPYACAGAWYYHDALELRVMLKVSLGMEPSENGEFYLSTALNGAYGYAHVLNKNNYHSWNTPEDLERDPYVKEIEK